MGCFPHNANLDDTVEKKRQKISTQMGMSSIISNNRQSPFKLLLLRRPTQVEAKYSIIKSSSLDYNGSYQVINNQTNKTFIMTEINKTNVINEYNFLQTFETLMKVKNDHLINIIDLFVDNKNYYVISDCFEGKRLFEEIGTREIYNEEMIATIVYFLFDTIDILSNAKVKNNIINPNRIYFHIDPKTKEMKVKIDTMVYIEEYLLTNVSDNYNLFFSSPELIESAKSSVLNYVWSIGVIMFCLIIGELPFEGTDKDEILQNIKSKRYLKTIEKASMSKKAKGFLKDILVINAGSRIDGKSILFQPFFEIINSKDQKELAISMEIRNKIKEIDNQMNMMQVTASFINELLIMNGILAEIIPVLKELIVKGDKSNDIIEEKIIETFGKAITHMKIMRVKDEMKGSERDYIDLLSFIVCNWYKINTKYLKKAFYQFAIFYHDKVTKKDLVNILSHSKSTQIIEIKNGLSNHENELWNYDDYEDILVKEFYKLIEEKDNILREFLINKDSLDILGEKWPFADKSFEMNNIFDDHHSSSSSD